MSQWSKDDLLVLFNEIEDPRIERKKLYPLNEVLFLTLYSALVNAESWRSIELTGNERIDFLRNFFEYKNGIPSHQTIGRIFSLLKPAVFEAFLLKWNLLLYGPTEGKQIALDGKTLRGSYDKSKDQEALHLLNVCAVDSGILLTQKEVGAKTNEITIVPEVLKSLDIKNAMISVDALNTQKDIAELIIKSKADYTLALKGNHKNLNQSVEKLFLNKCDQNHKECIEKDHGRISTRCYDIISVNKLNLPQSVDWKGLQSVGRVQIKTDKNDKVTNETRYYLLSYNDLDLFAKSSRKHWVVESFHWILDVTFSEDASRKRKDHAPRNFSLIRKFAINILKTVKGKLSIPNTRLKSAMNPEFLQSSLVQSGFKLRNANIF